MGSNESALELGVAMGKGATVTGSQRNCEPVNSREDVTESRGSFKNPQSPRRVLMERAASRGIRGRTTGRLEDRKGVQSDTNGGDPGQGS